MISKKTIMGIFIIFILFTFINCSGEEDTISRASSSSSAGSDILVIYSDTLTGIPANSYDWIPWNNTCDTNNYTADPAEGPNAMQIQNNQSNIWWGFGLEITGTHDLTEYAQGTLVFSMKSIYNQSLDIGMQSGSPDPNNQNGVVTVAPGTYGFINDGAWHEVKIPISLLRSSNPSFDITKVFIYLMVVNQGTTDNAPVYIDNIYLTKTEQLNPRVIPATTSTGPGMGTEHTYFSGYYLAWSDEFPGPGIDTLKWNYDSDGNANTNWWGTGEIQWHTDSSGDNAFIANSCLVIEAQNESYMGRDYTSARLHTHGNHSWQYGIIEARILLPANDNTSITDNGIWSAFWMLGDNFNGWNHDVLYGGDVGWAACGEIDILEVGGATVLNTLYGTIHYDDSGYEYSGGQTNNITTMFYEFHTYAVKWDLNKIEWYFDNNKFHEEDISVAGRTNEFRNPHFILLNLAIDGDMGGTPDPANYPQRMYIDWVRVYQ